ncbi:MAG: branched-chain amino acid ABC transporter permease [Candidatus Marinimicrobia bacterium]|jgi:branched-chain amino acid transport system permease protein|nr:branched-chain amino acid ABC transporter permease [Candidatus Neomarinimicrobiota bacterium]MDP7026349.1 branched-chain amino acid ABC transporter permease [Candidatus Neomarinimicrobiota bacterium]|tara:strand:+ start:10033 stop:10902 length:870 start_codon:yes stop_codon:yes gene_type:complete
MTTQIITYGITLGCVYALVALGLVLIYRATEIVNFAQGEMMMMSAYMFFTLYSMEKGLFTAVIGSLLFAVMLGVVMNTIISRPLIGKPIFAQIMATIALSIVLRSLTGVIWTHEDFFMYPPPVSMKPMDVGFLQISPYQIAIVGVSIILVLLLYLFLNLTRFGTAIKATSENPVAAQLMGIPIKRIYIAVWILSSLVSAVAGMLIIPQFGLQPMLGSRLLLMALPAAVLGGFGKLEGAIAGGLILGVLESLATVYLPTSIYDIFPWIILILMLLIRPDGLFGTPVRKRV